MKKITHLIYAFSIAFFASVPVYSSRSNGCSIAGTPGATNDTICSNNNTTLTLTGYLGNIQWQSFDGTNWIDETNPGATTDNYLVTLVATTDFRAVVTEPGCPSDTSVVFTIIVGINAPTTNGATRCGYGPVTLTASGSGPNFKWYDVPTGGVPLYTGPSFTTNVANTTTFYAAAATNGGGSATIPQPPQSSVFSPRSRGYWFTAPSNFTITGLYVPEPANGATQNIAVLLMNGGTPPPAYPTMTNAFTTLFLTQNDPSVGVIPVNIPIVAGDVIGVLASRGNDNNSYATGPYVTVIDGQNVTLTRFGMQWNLTTVLPMDVWQEPLSEISRLEITYEVGCESARIPTVATVTPSASISINATPQTICQGLTSTITVSSTNPNYTYTWSPATGLSGTTGNSNTATPQVSTTYFIVGDDGTCGAIDSVFIDVIPASVAGTSAISSDTICPGNDAFLTVAGYTGNIQWQSNIGSGWVDETGTGSTTDNYMVSPPISTQYRAVVTSGGCAPDTSTTIDLAVIIMVDPITVNDTICAPGFATLSASGPGVLNWYTSSSGGIPIHTGSTYSPNISTTTTYYVEGSAGGTYPVGAASPAIGTQATSIGDDYGLQFDVTQQCVIERVYVSPGMTGNIIINLRNAQGGPILNTATFPVVAFTGLVPIPLNFTINPGTGYRLELGIGSAAIYFNLTGATFPYATAGNPLTIQGSVDPVFNASANYYYFYNWEVKVGCSSNLVPVTGFVNSPPAVPSISQNGTILTSSAPTGNQWNLNGNPIPGATGVTHDMALSGSGSYTVTVTVNGCSSTSLPIVYTSINELSSSGISVYPNPVSEVLTISFTRPHSGDARVSIFNALGELVFADVLKGSTRNIPWTYPPGAYSVEISTGDGIWISRVVKL